ncbi:MAG: CDP-diacylglycerol--glycerol-3-phosphate 3-phosphatidyltransferase [Bacilli bacterium]|nr:CDP-diacylglycerol--glycerol-3-phosphate 3-phosphatidyltransferase [Bacilli bacterium]
MKINIPTKITISRIVGVSLLLILLLVAEILGMMGIYKGMPLGDTGIDLINLIAAVIFVLASITDYFDGMLARKWNQVTNLGKFLDPIADKMLVDSLLIFLVIRPSYNENQLTIPLFCTILMILRDLIIDTMRSVAAAKGKVVAANIFGKLKTVFQMIAIPVVILNGFPFSYFDASWHPWLRIGNWLIYIATLMSVLSAVIYLYQNRAVLLEEEKHENV